MKVWRMRGGEKEFSLCLCDRCTVILMLTWMQESVTLSLHRVHFCAYIFSGALFSFTLAIRNVQLLEQSMSPSWFVWHASLPRVFTCRSRLCQKCHP